MATALEMEKEINRLTSKRKTIAPEVVLSTLSSKLNFELSSTVYQYNNWSKKF